MEGLVYAVIGAVLVGWGWLRLRADIKNGGSRTTQFLYGLTVSFGAVAIVAGLVWAFA